MKRKLASTFLAAISVVGVAGVAAAGPLTPPVGPVTSTNKTLTEVEPRIAINATNTPGDADSLFKITQSGSYYLTGNITGVVGKHGIEIAASGVTLDLNGFDLVGVASMGDFDGVSVSVSSLTNIAVVNGSVRNWGDEGVDLGTYSASNCRVDRVLASGNAGIGNAGSGIRVGNGSTVTNCSANGNFTGINTGINCIVSNCTAYDNAGNGIIANNSSTVSNCSAYSNGANGILIIDNCTISGCSANNNNANGISTGLGCTVSKCTANSNTSNGIFVGSANTVEGCTVRGNTLDGMVCSSACVIRGNTSVGNGFSSGNGAGIHATSTDNRIEGNTCIQSDRGIDVDATGNIIIRNTCSGNTSNWEIVIGNSVGSIVVTSTNTVAISGNGPVASTLGSIDPNANFSY